ncbi:MAG TPA: gliding motility-associated C-terminal domain-containing protein [Flavobacteriaceae bacterium]|nr:gliding motility-associated C-terminal domain-containing protein [Flavobacteriaceae bacterium]
MIQNYLCKPFLFFLVFFCFLAGNKKISAQCAGNDTFLSICNIPANQTVDLFANLQGNPDPGGTWNSGNTPPIPIDAQTGVVNIWNLTYGGTYTFNYTINDASCTDKTSIFTLMVGGYPGVDNFDANACEDDMGVNLFQFIGSNPNPHVNGTWNDLSNTGALSANIYNASIQGPGTYLFSYTVPAVASCPALTSTVELTVHPLPNPGSFTNLELCGIADLANYTAVDLQNYHTGGDPNGFWSENSGTSQINNAGDQTINVQQIFNNNGYGKYTFTYTVYPDHPVCTPETATFTLIIRKIIDLTGVTIDINSICEDEIGVVDFVVNINNFSNLPNAQGYDFLFEYQITGPVSFTGSETITTSNPSFIVDNAFVPVIGNYTINITSITVTNDEDGLICDVLYGNLSDTFGVRPLPNIDNAIITIDDICIGQDATVVISDPTLDGTYTIDYNLSGANVYSDTKNVTFSNGTTSFTIDAAQLTNTGTTTFTIIHIDDGFCDNTANNSVSFEVNPLPDTSNISISIPDVCFGEPVQITINNLNGLSQVDITYSLSGANSLPNQTVSLGFSNGTAGFTIPGNSYSNTGITTFELHFMLNTITGCGAPASQTKDFEIFPLPPPITASSPQEFCEADQATVSELLPNGNDIAWFANQNDLSPLPGNSLLTSGDYWVSQISSQGCFSPKTNVSVVVHQIPAPTLIPDGDAFCGADDPTIADLTQNTQSGYKILWFDANGNPLDPTTVLLENTIYYGYAKDSVTGCQSIQVLEVSVSLTACPNPNGPNYDFYIPDAFSPNNDGTNDVFRIPDIQYLYENYKYEIYNRWGQLLFTGNIERPEWDGTTESSADNIAPNGVYFYIVYFNEEGTSPKQGRLYLNR